MMRILSALERIGLQQRKGGGIIINDYFIKKGITKLPLHIMSIGTYVVKTEKNVIESYYDANFDYHEIVSSKTKKTIEFNTPYLSEGDMSILLSFFSGDNKQELNYYDTKDNEYKTANFYMPDKLEPGIHRASGVLIYKPLKITLKGE